MGETVRQDPLDRQRLQLVDKQAEYFKQLKQLGTIDKAFELLEALGQESQEHDDPVVNELAGALEPFMEEPAPATLQIVPASEAIIEEDGYEASGLSFRWRTYRSDHGPRMDERFIRVYERHEQGSYEPQYNFTVEEVNLIRSMLDE